MTRFARAKGSKASNERMPEEATDWNEMKKQMLLKKISVQEAKKRKEFDRKREENYKAFLSEKKQFKEDQIWSTFPDENLEQVKPENSVKIADKQNKNDKLGKRKFKDSKINKISKSKQSNQLDDEIDQFCKAVDVETTIVYEKLTKKIEKKLNNSAKSTKTSSGTFVEDLNDHSENELPNEEPIYHASTNPIKKGKKVKSKKLIIPAVNENSELNNFKDSQLQYKNSIFHQNPNKIKKNKKIKKANEIQSFEVNKNFNQIQKDKMSNKDRCLETASIKKFEVPNVEKSDEGMKIKKSKKIKKSQTPVDQDSRIKSTSEIFVTDNSKEKNIKRKSDKANNTNNLDVSKKPKFDQKNKFDKEMKHIKNRNEKKDRRKPEPIGKQYITINGIKEEIVLFTGYPVKKTDAERLQKLREDMFKKGIPRNEVFRTIKLERRKAEKALSKAKKIVCFNCRKSGHLLSECSELNKKSNNSIETMGTGICFKCGSTEHTSFVCKVSKDGSFKYAKCFICGEQGHISRQCPDNPKGLYPQGGGCRICGDVTHLKKDCPQFQQKQEENTLTLDTLVPHSNVEDDLDDQNISIKKQSSNESKHKIIKF